MLRTRAPLTLLRRTQQAAGIRSGAGLCVRASSHHAAGADVFTPTDQFMHRHMGSQGEDRQAMLTKLGFKDMESLIDATLPPQIRLSKKLSLDAPLSETEALASLKRIMSKNRVLKSFIGAGYYETIVPGVIQRNVLENPGWYTAYTPYQAEIAQGRLQSLLNFQTMVTDLTGMALSNASLLDEATAAAEAMAMTFSLCNQKRSKFFVDARCHPQTIALTQTRGKALGMTVVVGEAASAKLDASFCGAMVQYPDTYGGLHDWSAFVAAAHAHEILTVACTDLLASVCIKPVGEVGFDIAVGSAQRFGVPMGFGGPHAAFLATTQAYSRKVRAGGFWLSTLPPPAHALAWIHESSAPRLSTPPSHTLSHSSPLPPPPSPPPQMPGSIIGVSVDSRGKPALRWAVRAWVHGSIFEHV